MTKLWSLVAKYWWIAALVAIAGLWLHEHDAAVSARATAKQQAAQIIQMADALKRFDQELSLRDSALVEINKKLADANTKIEQQKHAVQTQVAVESEELRRTLTVEQQIKFDSVITGFKTIIALSDNQINNLTAIVHNDSLLLADKDTLLAHYRTQMRVQIAQINKLTKLVGGSSAEKWINRVVTVAVIAYGVAKK